MEKEGWGQGGFLVINTFLGMLSLVLFPGTPKTPLGAEDMSGWIPCWEWGCVQR